MQAGMSGPMPGQNGLPGPALIQAQPIMSTVRTQPQVITSTNLISLTNLFLSQIRFESPAKIKKLKVFVPEFAAGAPTESVLHTAAVQRACGGLPRGYARPRDPGASCPRRPTAG